MNFWSNSGSKAISFLFICALLLFIFDGYAKDNQKIDAISQEKEEIKAQIVELKQENKQLRSEKKYLQSQQSELTNKNGYLTWPKIEQIADTFVEESDGRFKKSWALYLVKEAQKFDIDPKIVFELLKVETGGTFDAELVGPETKYGKAYGMGQFMKNTAPWVAEMAGLPYEEELLYDPYYSMQLSIVYLDYLHNEYGKWEEALTAYHRGMNGMEEFVRKNGDAKSWYAVEILSNAENHKTVATAN
ncbi:transglycosylase SLT domain-containing protein [Sediminibacillus halophilus]|uniref:Transglycosylase SLT domain-containing protein n=1 Tax=Sediminibacillus halophilus TaxID=482461 RepID=A0A1G9YH30_9BACI|nr:transglycosylase SLT domain-containing protein [Sediminibacillus halophilus]SDN08509.1 Transglycosylase SLT domain-containing protein [Sediminibacillus halophilus]